MKSSLQVSEETELVEITRDQLKFVHCNFDKPKQKLFGFDTDVKLLVGDKIYHAHRAILKQRSPFFQAMFSHDMMERDNNQITLQETSCQGFQMLLEYFYLGYVTIDMNTVAELLQVAQFYQVDWIISSCRIFLIQRLSFSDPEAVFQLAEMFQIENLQMNSRHFLAKHLSRFIATEQIFNIAYSSMLDLLSNDDCFVSVSELQLLKCCLNVWYDKVEREELYELLNKIKFAICSPIEELENLLTTYELLPQYETQLVEAKAFCDYPFSATSIGSFDKLIRGSRRYNVAISLSRRHSLHLHCFNTDNNISDCEIEIPFDTLPCRLEGANLIECHNFLLLFSLDFNSCDTASFLFDVKEFSLQPLCLLPGLSTNYSSAITENRVYLYGGLQNTTGEEHSISSGIALDLLTNSWLTLPPMPKCLYDHTCVIWENQIYIIGGISANVNDPLPVPFVFSRNIHEMDWSECPALVYGRYNHTSIVFNNQLFVFGGLWAKPDDPFVSDACPYSEVLDLTLPIEEQHWRALEPYPQEWGRLLRKHYSIDEDAGGWLYFVFAKTSDAPRVVRRFHLHALIWDEDYFKMIRFTCTHLVSLKLALQDF